MTDNCIHTSGKITVLNGTVVDLESALQTDYSIPCPVSLVKHQNSTVREIRSVCPAHSAVKSSLLIGY